MSTRIGSKIFAVVAATAFFASGASAATFECDTPNGRFSSWQQEIPAGAFVVSGTISMRAIRPGSRWGPVATASLRWEGDARDASVQFAIFPDDENQFEARVREGDEIMGTARLNVSEPAHFELRFSQGVAAVNAGGLSHSFAADEPPESIEFSCSSGDFTFTDVRIEPVS